MSAVVSRVPATVSAPLARLNKSGSPLMPIWVPVKRTDSTSTKPKVLLMVRPEVDPDAAVCVSEAAVSDIKMSSCIVATPATFNVLDKVAPWVTVRVLERVAAPVTPRVPNTAVFPVWASTVNLVVATLKSSSRLSVPATVKAPLSSPIRSSSVLIPINLSLNRTDSTSTYPFTLVMVSPPDAAECRKVAAVSDMIRFFCRVVSWATFRVLDRVAP
mmetsp:Transcript_10394/g.46911  ORF Transcript_10394/g.46911 Transcript_10394/m.46911 type:complete len:216 (-) Transcript_10394:813-1460(-)